MTEPATIPAAELLANLRRDTSDGVLRLASHAALPVVVDAGFVNLLRVNFFLDPPNVLPFEAEADLLLSPLCREIGGELYELDPAVRNLLLIMLQAQFGDERVRQVALLLEQYTQSTPTWTAQPELEQAQQLTALSFIDPARAQSWLDEVQTGAKTERLSPDWYVAMRARLADRPTANAQDELASALTALYDDSAGVRLGAVNTLAVLAQLPGTDTSAIVEELCLMLSARATSTIDRIGRDLQAALTLIGTLPRTGLLNLSDVKLGQADLRNLDLSECNLVAASLVRCDADGSNLALADLSSARLERVSMRGANLAKARLDHAILIDVDFSEANLAEAALPSPVSTLIRQGLIFTGANLADLQVVGGGYQVPDTATAAPSSVPQVGSARQRADALIQLASHPETAYNLDQAINAAEEAVGLYRQLSEQTKEVRDQNKLAQALIALSRLYADRGDLDQAIMIAEDTVAQLRSEDRVGLFPEALLDLGNLQYRARNYDGARRNLEEAVGLYRQGAAPASIWPVLSLGLLTLAELYADNHELASYYYDEAIELFRHAGPEYDAQLGSALLSQSQWLMSQSSFDDAESSAEEAKDIFTRLQDEAQLFACDMTLGDIATRQARSFTAVARYTVARTQAHQAGRPHDEALAWLSLADSYEHDGRDEEAASALMNAASMFLELGDYQNHADAQLRVARIRMKSSQWESAILALHIARSSYKLIDDEASTALTWFHLGEALRASERLDEAIDAFGRAADGYAHIPDRSAQGRTLNTLSATLIEAGRLKEALEVSQRAEEILRLVGDNTNLELAFENTRTALRASTDEEPRPAVAVMGWDFDLGLLIPLREEFDLAREVFEFGAPINDGGYYLHPFTVSGTRLRGLALVLFDLGLTGSAVAATRLLDRFEFGVLAAVGIAGALDPGLRLGDVVIASSVDEYLVAARATNAGSGHDSFEVGSASWVASRDLVTYAHNFRYLDDGFEAWQRRSARRLPAASDLARSEPDYLIAPLADGDAIGAGEAFAQWLRQHNRFPGALEMEAGGAARMVSPSKQTDILVVRGISDLADERKRDLDATAGVGVDRGAWRRYATLNAFDLLAALVTNPAFPWTTPRTAAEPEELHRLQLAVEKLERQFGSDHRRTLVARNNLAHACNEAGRPDLALPQFEAVAASFAKTKGDHPDTLTARSNLAATYRATGRLQEAIALDEQVLADRARVLGGDHPDTVTSRYNLAADHFEAGGVATAITLLRRVVADRERMLGSDHPDTGAARDNLAIAQEAQLKSSRTGL